ncbi:OST5 family protein [Acinetobacter sp. ANC 7454]|uniref:OST5 family protein n=1 Tax=Acinetobacter thermotolerans TaxID=3151487 RepID=UPI00325BC8CF
MSNRNDNSLNKKFSTNEVVSTSASSTISSLDRNNKINLSLNDVSSRNDTSLSAFSEKTPSSSRASQSYQQELPLDLQYSMENQKQTAKIAKDNSFHLSDSISTNSSKYKSYSSSFTGIDTALDRIYRPNKDSNEYDIFRNLEKLLIAQGNKQETNLLDKLDQAKKSIDASLNQAIADVDSHKLETKQELKETRNSVLGTIALFAAFFTFVSVNVNIFTKAENVIQSIIFMLSFWLCIIGFVSIFFFFLNKTKDTIWNKSLEFYTIIICISFTVILMFILFQSKDIDSYNEINKHLLKIESENKQLKEENSKLNNKILTQLKDVDEQIIELRKNQYQLNNH